MIFFLLSGGRCFSQVYKRPVTLKSDTIRLDTNRVVFDENGRVFRYYQYSSLINSGEYSIKGSRKPGEDQITYILYKPTVEQKLASFERVKSAMSAKSPKLQENMLLDLSNLKTVKPEDVDGKIKVLIFWSPSCPPCTESFQSLNDFFYQIRNPEDVVVYAITRSGEEEARKKLKEKPLYNVKSITNGSAIFAGFQLTSYPTFIIADKNDIIRFSVTGIGPQVISAFKSQLSSMLNQ